MQNGVIYGIDIARGSSRAQEAPRYAVAVLRDGEITHHTMLRLHRILRMLNKDRPDYIAVDNIFELAPNKKGLIHFLEKLPDNTRLVQVTGGIHQKPLLRLAHEHGLSVNQFDPVQEAEACAILASLGVGEEVSLFEDITRIKVSRARSLGRGGWSQNRYRRKVHGAVKEKSREIESILRKFSRDTGYRYTERITEGFGGYVRSEFTVKARRDRVPVKPSANADVQVTVRSVERDKIQYLPLKKAGRQYTIVGIDPGTTVGIAILSLDGELLLSESIRGISHDEVVRMIAEYGKPAIVATDVYPTPSAVEKIRRSFNAVIWSPGGEIRAEEKIALARTFGYSNDHERDSLTAAIATYKSYKNVFSRVEKRAPKYLNTDSIKLHVINGDSIEEAIEKVASESKIQIRVKPEPEPVKEELTDTDEMVTKLREELRQKNSQIKQLKEYVSELKYESGQKNRNIEKLEMRINKIKNSIYKQVKKEREIQIRDNEIIRLNKELAKTRKNLKNQRRQNKRLKQIRKKEVKGEGLPVKVISAFTREAIQHTKELYGLKENDVVFLKDPSGGGPVTASLLAESKVKAVLISEEMPHVALEYFYDNNIPVLKDVKVHRVGDLASIDPDMLDESIRKWQEGAEKRLREKEQEQFQSILEEYKSERRRGLV
jgi:predicted RNase H-like nuclease (RuvC/YqgF family)